MLVRANQQMPTRQRLKGLRQLGRCGEAHLDRLAGVIEHQRERQTRADGVRVGIDVADDADGGGGVQQVGRSVARRRAAPSTGGVSHLVDRGHRCPQRLARYPAPRRTLTPAITVRVLVARVLGTLPNSCQILICGASASQQILHVGGGIGHLVQDE